jgi:hypothetical protein
MKRKPKEIYRDAYDPNQWHLATSYVHTNTRMHDGSSTDASRHLLARQVPHPELLLLAGAGAGARQGEWVELTVWVVTRAAKEGKRRHRRPPCTVEYDGTDPVKTTLGTVNPSSLSSCCSSISSCRIWRIFFFHKAEYQDTVPSADRNASLSPFCVHKEIF